ncbi:MAG: DNA-protecting protein DprA [Elusimicrobia bacterium]|nr:DNA-protecting protein DprA [Elusimicrobiota bacterium]
MEAQARRFGGLAGFDAAGELERCRRAGIGVWTPGTEGYPELLASAPDAPGVLYVRGRLEARPAIALVGSRRPTPYGRRVARVLAAGAAARGLVVVSGLARGIDTEAHLASLEAGGATWAVLGSGLGRVYPPENRVLAERIASRGGAVVTEVPLSGPPLAPNFPRRNRIISALAWATIVVEGDLKSGALITARFALDQGREVGAVPGPVDSPMSEGPLRLIRDGAWPVGCIEDVLERLPAGVRAGLSRPPAEGPPLRERGFPYKLQAEAAPRPDFLNSGRIGPERQKVVDLIGWGEKALEELVGEAGMPVAALSRLLAELEIDGVLESLPGQRYALRKIEKN